MRPLTRYFYSSNPLLNYYSRCRAPCISIISHARTSLQIVKMLPKTRQTALFSATQTKKVEDLAKLAIQGVPVYVGVNDDDAAATVSTLEQGYVVCASEKRFLLLFTFLKRNAGKKVRMHCA